MNQIFKACGQKKNKLITYLYKIKTERRFIKPIKKILITYKVYIKRNLSGDIWIWYANFFSYEDADSYGKDTVKRLNDIEIHKKEYFKE